MKAVRATTSRNERAGGDMPATALATRLASSSWWSMPSDAVRSRDDCLPWQHFGHEPPQAHVRVARRDPEGAYGPDWWVCLPVLPGVRRGLRVGVCSLAQ